MPDPKWPQTVTFRSDPRRVAVLIAIFLVFVAACAALLKEGIFDEPHHDVLTITILVIGLILFGCFVAIGIYVIRHPNTLILDASGVSVKAFRTERFIPWGDAANAHIYLFGYVRSLALILTPEGALRLAKGAYSAPTNVDLGKGWKSDRTYSPQELAALINAYIAAFRLGGNGSKSIA